MIVFRCQRCHAGLVRDSEMRWRNVQESEPDRVKPTKFCPRCGANRIVKFTEKKKA